MKILVVYDTSLFIYLFFFFFFFSVSSSHYQTEPVPEASDCFREMLFIFLFEIYANANIHKSSPWTLGKIKDTLLSVARDDLFIYDYEDYAAT